MFNQTWQERLAQMTLNDCKFTLRGLKARQRWPGTNWQEPGPRGCPTLEVWFQEVEAKKKGMKDDGQDKE